MESGPEEHLGIWVGLYDILYWSLSCSLEEGDFLNDIGNNLRLMILYEIQWANDMYESGLL